LILKRTIRDEDEAFKNGDFLYSDITRALAIARHAVDNVSAIVESFVEEADNGRVIARFMKAD
jgi:hypothetical protein